MKLRNLLLTVLGTLLFIACTFPSAAAQNFTLSASVTGLASGVNLKLEDNLAAELEFTSDGTLTFSNVYASGASYSVTIFKQPVGQTCTLGSNASGTITGNTTVAVTCVNVYTLSAAVSGLATGGVLKLEDNVGNQLQFTTNTTLPFSSTYLGGASYSVTIFKQPTGQTCTLGSNASGTITANTTVAVTCTTNGGNFTIGVAVTGLTGTLVMQDDKNDNLTFTTNNTQTFATSYAGGSSYTVSVKTQPAGQTCTLSSNASGIIGSNITVTATCTTNVVNYTISVAVTGLTGTLLMQDDKNDNLTFTTNSTQTFATSYASGSTYTVSVKTQPAGQTCTLSSNATGTITSNTTVTATCVSNYTISVAVTGLTGTLVMQDDKSDQLTFTTNSTQTFATSYTSGSTYSVTVKTQPTGQTCTLSSNASGTITSNITVTATCATVKNYTISVKVTGLTGTLVVQDSKSDQLTFTTNTTQTFATSYASGSTYTVTVLTQPTGQTCTLSSNATGTITSNITVTATCTAVKNYTISVKVTGLTGTLVVQDSKSDQLTFTTNSTQTFATSYASGSTYTVTVLTQPTGQTCTLGSNASGTIKFNITVNATCKTNTYKISVAVTGLSGTFKVKDDKAATLTFTTNNTQTFSTLYNSGSTYTVSITSQPAGQTCTLGSNATGTITSNITVTATCTTNGNDTISVAVTGLTGTLVVQDSKSDKLTFTTNTTQTFATSYASGSTYTVTVLTQPTGQTCKLSSNASGTITSNITVTATCTTNVVNFTISVAVTGLTGTLVMQDDKSDQLTFTTNSTQKFATSYASGSTYTVSVKTQPAGQTCTLSSNASGTITSNITVTATCAASLPTISVNVTGLSGTVVMEDDKGDTLTFTSNNTQTFASTYASGATYTVSVTNQPSTQSCVPTYSTGTITSNITISAICATGSTRQLGTITGVSTISCQGAIRNGVCQQMTVSCPGVPDVSAYVKTNSPTGTSKGTVTYNTGTDGNGLYESIFTFGSTAVQNVINAGFTTVQIDWGSPFNNNQPNGWVEGPGGTLAAACRYATVTQWIYTNIQNNTGLPYCATGNSGGAGALAYALSQYNSGSILSMAEVTSGPPAGRLDWGCGCQEGKLAVQCGTASTLGTCFGNADAPVWDPAYNPTATTGVCKAAVNGTLPPGGLNFFLGDSVEAPGANYTFPHTFVNVVFGGADNSSAIPIGQDWLNNITTSKGQGCVAGGVHSLANTQAGADQIANDLINFCKVN
jgi:hypothetical protein